MTLEWQLAGIGALFVLLYVLHRRARRTDFERFRAYHRRRKYRVPVDAHGQPIVDTAAPDADDGPGARPPADP